MNHSILIISLVFVVVSVVLLLVDKKETFDPQYKTERKTFIDNTLYTSKDPNVLSHGTVQKYKIGDIYKYEFMYNLPIANAPFQVVDLDKSFNPPTLENKYKVFAGTSKDDMTHVGELTRRGDGYHILVIETDKNYTRTCLSIGDDIIQCSDIS